MEMFAVLFYWNDTHLSYIVVRPIQVSSHTCRWQLRRYNYHRSDKDL